MHLFGQEGLLGTGLREPTFPLGDWEEATLPLGRCGLCQVLSLVKEDPTYSSARSFVQGLTGRTCQKTSVMCIMSMPRICNT